jgi:DNA invertase Pin-like site-specific DNA recombinase
VVREVDREANRRRPGLKYVLERLSAGTFECLVVTRLDQLAASETDLARTLRAIEAHAVRLVVIEIDYDSATGDGRLVAGLPA